MSMGSKGAQFLNATAPDVQSPVPQVAAPVSYAPGGFRQVAPGSFVPTTGAFSGGSFAGQAPAAPAPPAEPPITREELMRMMEEAQGKRVPQGREDAQDRERDPSLLGKSQAYDPGMTADERQEWWDSYDDAGLIGQGLIDADQAIQENPLLALAPLGMIGGGAGLPLMAASGVNSYQSGNIGMGLGGMIGGGLRNLIGGPSVQVQVPQGGFTSPGNNISARDASALAAAQRASMAQQIRDNSDRGAGRTTQQAARERSLGLAERSARNPNDLPY